MNIFAVTLVLFSYFTAAQVSTFNVDGNFPQMGFTASSGPERTECGVGAMMAWNDMLYVVTYLSVPNGGSGTGLYSIDKNFTKTLLMSHNSTYANRMIHVATDSIIIGPYVISKDGEIRVFESLLNVRIGGMSEHLTNPNMVYFLGMDGPFWQADVTTLEVTQLFNLVTELNINSAVEQPHFKATHTMAGVVYVASNTFNQFDYLSLQHGGRFASWRGPGTNWTIIDDTGFVEVTGRKNFGCTVFALGSDAKSVILHVIDNGCGVDPSYNTSIQTYRLPRGSMQFDHLWTTEWMRIREVESERYILDAFGTFFTLSSFTYGGATWNVAPISRHLRLVPDFTQFNGLLVLGGNTGSSIFDNNLITGQSASNLWFGKTDDLWSFGTPQGYGMVWRFEQVPNGMASDPFLMTGYVNKVVHFRCDNGQAGLTVQFTIQIDFSGSAGHRGGDGETLEPWGSMYTTDQIQCYPGGYTYYTFPSGFSAHWVRFVPSYSNTALLPNITVSLTYT
jgi:hypothetical protein